MLFLRKNLDPVIVRVGDEVQAHRFILVADAAHLPVAGPYLVVVFGDPEAQVELTFPKVVWLWMVPEPCELQLETCLPVTQEYQDEGAVFSYFPAGFMQA